MKNHKYRNLDELTEAYRNGDLAGEDSLVMDDDGDCFVNKNGVEIFGGNQADLLEEALFLLGIPCDRI